MSRPVDSDLRKARSLTKAGRLAEAENIYLQILQKFPKNKKALEGLQKLSGENGPTSRVHPEAPKEQIQELISLYKQGRFEETSSLAQQLSELFPSAFMVFSIMGASNASLGRLDQAEDNYRQTLALKPDYADAHNNLANVLQQKGDLNSAIISYQKAIDLKPGYSEAHANLGKALKALGETEKAVSSYQRALKIQPNNPENLNNLGVTQQTTGALDDAIQSYKRAIELMPDYVEAYNNAAVALKTKGEIDLAIAYYQEALRLNPKYTEAHYNLGNIKRELEDWDGAVESYQQAINHTPDHLNALCNLASALNQRGDTEEAIKYCQQAISINPDFAEAHNNMGVYLREKGDLADAGHAFQRSILANPDFAEAHRNLSIVKKYHSGDEQFDQMQRLQASSTIVDDDLCHIYFALAKAYEDIGDLELSFDALEQGNALRKKILGYNLEQDEIFFASLRERDKDWRINPLPCDGKSIYPTPIFIVGMPRSGTTLIEQIISSHSSVTPCGELTTVGRLANQLMPGSEKVTESNLLRFREQYLDRINQLAEDKPYITDKMPQNFLYLNLISKALPEAKIIHTQRDAAATCWSNFKTYFTKNGLGYCYDLKDVVEYYRLYVDLISYWDENYSQGIYHLNYEQLTLEQDSETRRLIEHLGLGWEEACLYPEKNNHNSKTASSQQVRRKVYKDSSSQWKIFEPFIRGAFENFK